MIAELSDQVQLLGDRGYLWLIVILFRKGAMPFLTF